MLRRAVEAGRWPRDRALVAGRRRSPRAPGSGARRSSRRRRAVAFRLPLHVWTWWMLPSGSTRPLQPMRNAWCLPSSLSVSGRGELLRRAADVEAGLARPCRWMTSPTRRCARVVDDRHLEAVAAGQPGVGQELLGPRHVAARALAALVEEDADRRDRRAARRVLAVPRHLVQGLAVDAELEAPRARAGRWPAACRDRRAGSSCRSCCAG